ncbi:NADH dehydrogenase [ubiquinone] 1 alpha subcomplex subunit 3 [Desmophyllum pertusum]|uniref:NADH dehydrogenase [ubiquinone] 1 alpha subcomplex subunit 3 n=1 Tax=Desmophyllum pertusum TaxID=174260 RepID=A0A9W9YGM3_9CNID|nr:NADH dehydrogenase [ubiquinone] 1 alpha subcomplex subunit 3 [Desmophyllum pertusum]
MAGIFGKSVGWLKYAWAKEPVIFMSCVFGFSGPLFVLVSPWTKDTAATLASIPHVYPYPQLENKDLSGVDSQGEEKKFKILF